MNAASGTGYRIAEHARLDARNTFGVRASAPMLVEATGYRRNRLFRYQAYIALFGEPGDATDGVQA